MDSELLNLDSHIKNANSVKEIVISRLLTDGVISEEKAKEYTEKWQIIIFKSNWFKRWFSIFRKDSDLNEYIFKFVKFED